MKRRLSWLLLFLIAIIVYGCDSAKHVPEGKYLLDKVKVVVADSSARVKQDEDLLLYLRQQPNHKIFWSAKMRLGIYNMSGKDSTKWWNRWIRKLGEPPVIYDSVLTEAGVRNLRTAIINKGFLHPSVTVDTIADTLKRKMRVVYNVSTGYPHKIRSVDYQIADSAVRNVVLADSLIFPVHVGENLDRNLLELQRELITNRLKNRGYYDFVKENISFVADTVEGSRQVDLSMVINAGDSSAAALSKPVASKRYVIRKVWCVTEYNSAAYATPADFSMLDTVNYKNLTIIYGDKKYLRPSVIYENNFIIPGNLYSERSVDRTYKAFSRLEILKYINIRFDRVGEIGETALLDAYILLTPGKSQSMSAELEGTNSEGDLGVAVGLSYSHRNIGKGSEAFTAKIRGAYESVSGNLEGLIHNRYMEYSADLGLEFPKFKAPFLNDGFKRRVNASTELHVSMNYQERPEYTRIISTAGWSYKWTERPTGNRHTFTPIDINYVYIPESTNDFINNIAPDNPLLRYSYEDHFIMRMGYSFYHTNKRPDRLWDKTPQRDIYTVRINTEVAGNLLFAVSSIFNHRSDFHSDPYEIFGIHYSQYFKVDSDFGYNHTFDSRQSLAARVGFGIGVPYGNSDILPFEKRFYGGGANGVRGWAVRTLGPGRFRSQNDVADFMNQCGDIRFIMSAEYRAKLFWIVELGLFIDVGNIWTIHNYPNQPEGMFRFNSFYKELAASYGVGLRLDFNYFLIRFDLGMKAHNPALDTDPWPLIHPRWGRDRAFHFSIGYPF